MGPPVPITARMHSTPQNARREREREGGNFVSDMKIDYSGNEQSGLFILVGKRPKTPDGTTTGHKTTRFQASPGQFRNMTTWAQSESWGHIGFDRTVDR
eukprot:1189666-Prorocentrum_minimum.AAC.1